MDPLNVGKLNSFFGEGIVLKGKLKFKGILRLDGDLEGEVTSGETLIIGKSGKVHADIKTDNLFNFGGLVGNIHATNKISLHAQSTLRGDIISPYLVAEESSFFDGSCQMPLDKRGPAGKVGKGNMASPSPMSLPKSPIGIANYGHEGEESSSKKKIAALVMLIGLTIGWLAFGGGYENVAKMLATLEAPGGASDEKVETKVETKKEPAKKSKPQIVINKKKEPKPLPKPAPKVKVILSETDQLRKEIQSDPLDSAPWLKLASLSLKKNNHKEAILVLKKSLDALPKSSELRILIAKTYQKVGREKEARKHFLVLAENDPRSVEAKGNDGYKSLERGALGDAARIFGDILTEDPENHRARLGLAIVYSRREENGKAATECLRILKYSKDYAPAMNRLAWIYAKQGLKLKEAKVLSERSITVFSDIPEYLDTLSEINFRLGEYEKAIGLIQKAIALAPDDSYYERQLFKFERARKRNG